MKWLDKVLGITRLDLGVPCKWEDIKTGSVFGVDGCFNIMYKETEDINSSILLADDFRDYNRVQEVYFPGNKVHDLTHTWAKRFYKLPKETQELWLCTEDN